MKYEEGRLLVYPSTKGRNKTLFSFDELGNATLFEDIDLKSPQMQELQKAHWNGWNSSSGKRTYTWENTMYCYEEASFFSRLIRKGFGIFYIQNGQNDPIMLYQAIS